MNNSERLGRIEMALISIPLHYENEIKIEKMKSDMMKTKQAMASKQTVVEWLEEKINFYNFEVGMGSMRKYIEHAKQMHKEQIMDAWDKGDCCVDLPNGDWEQKYKSAEQYYNETYATNLPS